MFRFRVLRSMALAIAIASFGCQLPQGGSTGSPGSAGGEGGPAAAPGRVALEQGTAGGSSGGGATDWHEEGPLSPALTAFFEYFAPMWITPQSPDRDRLVCDRATALRLRAEAVRDEIAAANGDAAWRDGARALIRAVEGIQLCATSEFQSVQHNMSITKDAFHALAEHWRTTHRPH